MTPDCADVELASVSTPTALRQVFQFVAVAAVVVAIDYLVVTWALHNLWSSASYAVLMPLLVGQVALLAHISARCVQPATLQWFVYAWSLVLVDLNVFSAMLSTRRDWWSPGLSALGYALLAGQIGGLVVWLVLGHSSWPWRIATSLIVAGILAVLVSQIAVAQGRWSAYVWPMILLAQGGIVLAVSLLARAFHVQLRSSEQDASAQAAEPLRFSLHHLLVWTTSVCLLLVLLRGFDLMVVGRFEMQDLFPLGVLGVNLAAGSVVAVWAALGNGHWLFRLVILGLAAAGSGGALRLTSEIWARPRPTGQTDLIHIVSHMGNACFVWTALSMCFLAALLLFFRSQGLRLSRAVRRP